MLFDSTTKVDVIVKCGIDPGKDYYAYAVGKKEVLIDFGVREIDESLPEADAYIIELPTLQGQARVQRGTFEMTVVAGRLIERAVRTGKIVLAVPSNAIRRQAGYTTDQGNFDRWWKQRLGWLGYDVSRKGLANDHLRDAANAMRVNINPQNRGLYEVVK